RARFDGTAHAAEEIQLPEGIEAGVVDLLILTRDAEGTWKPLLGVSRAGGHLRQQIETRFAPESARIDHSCERDAQIVVRAQRVVDKALQCLVAELRPELSHRILR